MSSGDQNQNNEELQGNIQLVSYDQKAGISSSQYNQNEQTAEQQAQSTLEEPVSETLKRDLRMIAIKLKYVLLPKPKDDDGKLLRNWDLWGPLLLCLLLACTLSIATEKGAETVFAVIFVIIWIGAGAVTLNAKLLGGQISFFQSVCLLGYCVFPVNLASILAIFIPSGNYFWYILKLLICIGSFIWSSKASVPFMQALVKEEKKFLAVYPVFLFYLFLSWFVLIA